MAWIMKNSATAPVARRAEPYLDEATKALLEADVIPRYPTRRASTLPVLHAVQDRHGWLPTQAIEEIADFLGLKASEVLDTASFYEMYWLQPKGKYLIMVCESISCELMGHEKLMEKLHHKLGVEVGETTKDGKFTLMHAECLGACDTAPCALINETLHEHLTPDNIDALLDKLP
ncbi:MAG: NADH-quinone oxidoreductase subunit NuoE [Planctomycetota bacterium]|nr:NADH-quinone oxidoreductase subunit NuoE [Planctomycetota bacterium]